MVLNNCVELERSIEYYTYTNENVKRKDAFSKSTKVIIEKSRGEGSLMEQDTIENVS
jgi:hypothetical protein